MRVSGRVIIFLRMILAVRVWWPTMATVLPASPCFNIPNPNITHHLSTTSTCLQSIDRMKPAKPPAHAITQLNDPKLFGFIIDTSQLTNTLPHQAGHSSQLLAKISEEVQALRGKSVFVALKWLIFLHSCLQQLGQNKGCLAFVEMVLGKVQLPTSENKHEQYFRNQLVVPYLQYLVKLSQLLRVRLTSTETTTDNEVLFMEFNLMVGVGTNFERPVLEFTNYLTKHYPYLTKYSELLAEDAQLTLTHLKANHSPQRLKGVSLFEMEQIQSTLHRVLGIGGKPGSKESESPVLFSRMEGLEE